MVKLGDLVRDPVSGLTGVAVSEHRYPYGCVRIAIQPPVANDGKLPDQYYFDAPQLEVLEVGKGLPKGAKAASDLLDGEKPGGPDKYIDVRPSVPKRS